MLRTDGEYLIYMIQAKSHEKGTWFDHMYNNEYFTASGDCWQETGVHGTYDYDEAVECLVDATGREPLYEFRLVAVAIKQSTFIIN